MGRESGIEWTDATWNPWTGCHKISPGCKNCYMFRDKARYGQDPNVVTRSKTTFEQPLRWKEPLRIFTCSWSDWFIEEADAWRDEAWDVIRRTPHHRYQILTKRIDRAAGRVPVPALPNAWIGVSVESDRYKDRIDILRETPAAIRFLSLEPLLSDLGILNLTGIDWVIAGGESGPNARPSHPDWFRSLRDQCQSEKVSFFFKQWGEWIHGSQRLQSDENAFTVDTMALLGGLPGEPIEWADRSESYRIGKKAAGRLLDRREWNEVPKGVQE